jgi:hypothetical protein
MKDQEGSLRAGLGIAGVGAVVALLAYVRPEAMRAPPFVVYLCALAFVFAGWTLVARARGHRLLKAWLPVFLLACLVAPAVWLGFGSGRRQCTLSAVQSLVRIFGTQSDLVCRIGFGVAAVVGIALVLLAVRHAIRSSREPPLE